MTGSQTPSPSQMLEYGRHYEAEGNYDYAHRFYAHIVDHFPAAPEAPEARAGIERLALQQHGARTAEQPSAYAPGGTGYDEVPRTNPPRLSLDVGARPVRSQTAAKPHDAGKPMPQGPSSPSPAVAPRHPPAAPGSQPTPAASPPGSSSVHARSEPSLGYPTQRAPSSPRSEAAVPHGPSLRSPAPQPFPTAHAPPAHAPPAHAPPAYAPPAGAGAQVSDPSAGEKSGETPRLVRRDGQADEDDVVDFVPGYRIGRLLAFLLVLFGWLALLAGIAFAGLAIAGVAGTAPVIAWGGMPLGVLVGIAGVVAAVVMVFLGSLAQAAFEAANNTRELLEIERAKAGW